MRTRLLMLFAMVAGCATPRLMLPSLIEQTALPERVQAPDGQVTLWVDYATQRMGVVDVYLVNRSQSSFEYITDAVSFTLIREVRQNDAWIEGYPVSFSDSECPTTSVRTRRLAPGAVLHSQRFLSGDDDGVVRLRSRQHPNLVSNIGRAPMSLRALQFIPFRPKTLRESTATELVALLRGEALQALPDSRVRVEGNLLGALFPSVGRSDLDSALAQEVLTEFVFDDDEPQRAEYGRHALARTCKFQQAATHAIVARALSDLETLRRRAFLTNLKAECLPVPALAAQLAIDEDPDLDVLVDLAQRVLVVRWQRSLVDALSALANADHLSPEVRARVRTILTFQGSPRD